MWNYLYEEKKESYGESREESFDCGEINGDKKRRRKEEKKKKKKRKRRRNRRVYAGEEETVGEK